jgi:murein DD-endopeptidase MepM/ murein hydrolase activator NlpD
MKFQGVTVDWPLDSNKIRRGSDSNTFGNVRRNADKTPRAHQGWDFYAKSGTTCYSIAAGEVKFADNRGALGLLIVISIKGTEYFAAYAHMSKSFVKPGDVVKLGQPIGLTGNTGNASSMKGEDEHLHFEVREQVITGLGLDGRISPLKVFGTCPLKSEVKRGYE